MIIRYQIDYTVLYTTDNYDYNYWYIRTVYLLGPYFSTGTMVELR